MEGRSIRPTIFDLYAEPEIVLPLALANLMSPRLWSLAKKIDEISGLDGRASAAQRLVNRHFTHLAPDEVARIDGVLSLDDVAAGLGSEVVGRAIDGIVATAQWRVARGTLANTDALLRMIDEGVFPNYVYGTINELHAHKRLLGKPASRPLGITSCLDEAVLFGSLLGASGTEGIEGIVLIGSAAHYTAFVWTGSADSDDFAAWWFLGKNALLRLDDYHRIIDVEYAGDAVTALADRMPIRDLLVSRRGVWNWATSTSALPADEIDRTAQALRRFFRDGIPELDEVVSRARPEVSLDGYDVLLEASTRGRSADEVCSVVFSSDLPEAVEARLCLRDATLGLEPFLPAATRGTRIASLGTRERGYEALAAMPTDAVFDEENRVGMPEEVLAYSTAGSLDRDLFALLLGDAGNR